MYFIVFLEEIQTSCSGGTVLKEGEKNLTETENLTLETDIKFDTEAETGSNDKIIVTDILNKLVETVT